MATKRKNKRWTKTAIKKSKGNTGPPLCRLCMASHWARDPHKLKPTNGVFVEDNNGPV